MSLVRSAPCRITALYQASWVTRPAPSRPGALAAGLLAEARRSLTHLSAPNGPEIFLPNGSRLSVDQAGLLRIETPECRDPSLAVLYVRAGERSLLELAERLSLSTPGAIAIGRVSGGWHESLFLPDATTDWADRLLPFIISRIIYSGTGGFDPSTASLRFVMSLQAHQLQANPARLLKGERVSRLRLKPPTVPGRWFQILAGDHGPSDSAALLEVGATMLVAHLTSRAATPPAWRLRQPLRAWRAFAEDSSLRTKARLTDGRSLTAIELQRHYLELVEQRVEDLPTWAGSHCDLWRSTLDRLEARQRVDWIEWQVRLQRLERRIQSEPEWQSLAGWNDRWDGVVGKLGLTGLTSAEDGADALDRGIKGWASAQGVRGDGAVGYHRLGQSLRALDAAANRVDPAGAAGTGRVFTDAQADNAQVSAPADTRAAVRAKWVRRLGATDQRARFRCDWDGVWDLVAGTSIDLTDPGITAAEWRPRGAPTGQRDLFSGFIEWFERDF